MDATHLNGTVLQTVHDGSRVGAEVLHGVSDSRGAPVGRSSVEETSVIIMQHEWIAEEDRNQHATRMTPTLPLS